LPSSPSEAAFGFAGGHRTLHPLRGGLAPDAGLLSNYRPGGASLIKNDAETADPAQVLRALQDLPPMDRAE
jgi:hypothetical protein